MSTSSADFPRLASRMACDRFLPAQFANLGDRLVFANGIITPSVFAAILVLPEFVLSWWWQQFLHNPSIFRLKAALHYRRGIVVTSVPYHLR